MKAAETKRNKWNETKRNDFKRNDTKRNGQRNETNENACNNTRNETKRNEMKWNEMKTRFLCEKIAFYVNKQIDSYVKKRIIVLRHKSLCKNRFLCEKFAFYVKIWKSRHIFFVVFSICLRLFTDFVRFAKTQNFELFEFVYHFVVFMFYVFKLLWTYLLTTGEMRICWTFLFSEMSCMSIQAVYSGYSCRLFFQVFL